MADSTIRKILLKPNNLGGSRPIREFLINTGDTIYPGMQFWVNANGEAELTAVAAALAATQYIALEQNFASLTEVEAGTLGVNIPYNSVGNYTLVRAFAPQQGDEVAIRVAAGTNFNAGAVALEPAGAGLFQPLAAGVARFVIEGGDSTGGPAEGTLLKAIKL